ncbi:hypothetical protein EKH55_0622 [Sinorhizobium alkalisoli]|nr:hypothetical protein EKH55_0622 [Sinorhizobium alkalisoli]
MNIAAAVCPEYGERKAITLQLYTVLPSLRFLLPPISLEASRPIFYVR